MDIPDWMCTVICAGLDLKTIMSGEDNVEENTVIVKEEESISTTMFKESGNNGNTLKGVVDGRT